MSLNIGLQGGQIHTLNNIWFGLFIIFSFMVLGRKTGLIILLVYFCVIITYSVARYNNIELLPSLKELSELDYIILTPFVVSLYAGMIFILMDGMVKMHDLTEGRILYSLSLEKDMNQAMQERTTQLEQSIALYQASEAALSYTKEILEQAQAKARFGNYTFNPQTKEQSWSHFSPTLFFQPEGTPLDIPSLISSLPEDTQNIIKHYFQEVTEKLVPVQFVIRIFNPETKEPRYLSCNNYPVLEENGTLQSIRGTFRDVTIETLYNMTLVTQKEAAEASARDKANFLSTMSHEIRTPLNAVIGLVQNLILENPRQDQVQSLNTMQRASQHLLRMLNDILDFSKMEADKLQINLAPTPIYTLLEETVLLFRPVAKDKKLNISLQNSLPKELVVMADELRIQQVINNLLGNAIKFTDHGAVTLHASIAPVPTQEGAQPKQNLTIAIQDTGIGIAEEKLATIFDSFKQADGYVARKYGGTGLGLTISKKLAELMGGNLKVTSVLGEGSCFTIEIPLQIVENADSLSAKSKTPTDGHNGPLVDEELLKMLTERNLKVLLVEDNPINVLVARKSLNKIGITKIEEAENGLIAYEKACKTTYDLILMDLQMPVMNGFQSAIKIRKYCKKDKHTPILALTAGAADDLLNDIMASGMNGYVTKPFIISVLQRAIYNAVTPEKAIA